MTNQSSALKNAAITSDLINPYEYVSVGGLRLNQKPNNAIPNANASVRRCIASPKSASELL